MFNIEQYIYSDLRSNNTYDTYSNIDSCIVGICESVKIILKTVPTNEHLQRTLPQSAITEPRGGHIFTTLNKL